MQELLLAQPGGADAALARLGPLPVRGSTRLLSRLAKARRPELAEKAPESTSCAGRVERRVAREAGGLFEG